MMSEADTERRLARVEARTDGIEEKLDDIQKSINSIALGLAAKRDCPEPGLCLGLEAEIQAIEAKIGVLHDWHQQAIGIQQGAKAVWAVIGGLVVALVTWAATHVQSFFAAK